MWKLNVTGNCEYSEIGTYEGLQLDSVWVSDDASLRLSFGNISRKGYTCGAGLELTEEGFGVRDLPNLERKPSRRENRQRRSASQRRSFTLVTEAELNAKLGYLDDKVMQVMKVSFSQALKSVCEYMVETRRWAASALLSDPTEFARVLFKSGNLVGKRVGPGLLKVWPCVELQGGDYKFLPIESYTTSKESGNDSECFDMIPIEFGLKGSRQLGFVDPKTMIVSLSARRAPCGEFRKQLIFVNGNLSEIDQVNGDVKLVKVGQIDRLSTGLPDPPTFASHSFHHLALVNVTDILGHVFDADQAKVSEMTFQIRKTDTMVIKTLSEKWKEVRDEVQEAIYGGWLDVGRAILVGMVIIVFADFLIRFGLMLREEYKGKGISGRMTFGRRNNQQDEPKPNDDELKPKNSPASESQPAIVLVEQPTEEIELCELNLSPVKLIPAKRYQ